MLFALYTRGGFFGIHPEGTRNKGADPYALLPGKPGLGRLVRSCHPDTLVLPFFVLGISNSVVTEVTRKLFPSARKEPIRMHFGAPISCGDLQEHGEDASMTKQVMKLLQHLADQDQDLMTPAEEPGPTLSEADPVSSNGTNG